jgi:hypothetical protein
MAYTGGGEECTLPAARPREVLGPVRDPADDSSVPSPDAPRASLTAVGSAVGRSVLRVLTTVLMLLVVVVAVGDAVGRWRVVPAPSVLAHTGYAKGDLVVAAPMPARRIEAGDVVVVKNKTEHGLFRVEEVVDSFSSQVRFAGDPPDRTRTLHATMWRVNGRVPWLGQPFALLAGPVQSAVLVLAGFALVYFSERRRSSARVQVATG